MYVYIYIYIYRERERQMSYMLYSSISVSMVIPVSIVYSGNHSLCSYSTYSNTVIMILTSTLH